jgi:hypothetical protein
MVDSFMDRGHLCLVFELLSVNLFELIAQNQYKGLSTNLIRIFLRQILKALVVLEECGIIHCDLKPENILLRKYAPIAHRTASSFTFSPTHRNTPLSHSLSPPSSSIQHNNTTHQAHRLWKRVLRASDSVHLHTVSLLSITRSPDRPSVRITTNHAINPPHPPIDYIGRQLMVSNFG